LDTQGAVVVRYDCPSYGSLSAVVQMSDYVHKLYLNSIAQSAEEYWYGTTLDAVVWSPDKRVSGFMSMINTSTEPKSVQVSFIVKGVIRDLQEIQIAPHQLRKLPIDSLIKNSLEAGAGIHIAFSGKPGEIVAEGTLLNKKTGFSKYLRFVDKDLRYSSSSIKSNFLFLGVQPVEDGFPTGLAFRSVAVMRNISSVSTQVTPVVQYLIDASVRKVSLPPLALKAGESRVIDFAKEQAAGRLPADLRQGTLELDPDSNQAAVIGELFNFNDNGPGYVVGPSFTAHPARATAALWRTDGTFQTTIVIQNTGQDDQMTVKIFSEGASWERAFDIRSGGMTKINLKQIQQDAVPDKDGKLLVATSGTLSISGSHGNQSALTFDKIIHSADEADYVGHVSQPCDFVSNIQGFLTGSNNPFTPWLEEDWADGSVIDYEGWPPASSNPSLVSVSNTTSEITFLPNGSGSVDTVTLTFTDTTETCDECTTSTLTDAIAVASKSLTYLSNSCTVDPNTGNPTMVASWGTFGCALSGTSFGLPPGGSCVTFGSKNCYLITTPSCATEFCPGDKRVADGGCTKFLDEFPITSSKSPAGCS
jgi:hypothetical protein